MSSVTPDERSLKERLASRGKKFIEVYEGYGCDVATGSFACALEKYREKNDNVRADIFVVSKVDQKRAEEILDNLLLSDKINLVIQDIPMDSWYVTNGTGDSVIGSEGA